MNRRMEKGRTRMVTSPTSSTTKGMILMTMSSIPKALIRIMRVERMSRKGRKRRAGVMAESTTVYCFHLKSMR